MAAMRIKATTTEDRQHVCIDLSMDGKALGHILLETSDAETFCQSIAECRKRLNEQVSTEIDPGSRLQALFNPMWAAVSQHIQGKRLTLMLIRHQGLGWLPFLFPPEQAAALGQELMDVSKPPSP